MTRYCWLRPILSLSVCILAADVCRAEAQGTPSEALQYQTEPTPLEITLPDACPPYPLPQFFVTFITDGPLGDLIKPDAASLRDLRLPQRIIGLMQQDAEAFGRLSSAQQALWRNNVNGWLVTERLDRRGAPFVSQDVPASEHAVSWALFPDLAAAPPLGVTENALRVYRFEAASEDDARLIMEQILAYANAGARENRARTAERLAEMQRRGREAEAQLADAQARLAQATATLATVTPQLGYENVDFATRELADVVTALRRLDVDLAGTNARSEAVERLMKTKPNTQMLVDQRTMLDIELAGLLGRQQTLRNQRQTLETFVQTSAAQSTAQEDCSAAQATLNRLRRPSSPEGSPLTQLEDVLQNPPVEMRPVHLADNTVVLRPVKVLREAPKRAE